MSEIGSGRDIGSILNRGAARTEAAYSGGAHATPDGGRRPAATAPLGGEPSSGHNWAVPDSLGRRIEPDPGDTADGTAPEKKKWFTKESFLNNPVIKFLGKSPEAGRAIINTFKESDELRANLYTGAGIALIRAGINWGSGGLGFAGTAFVGGAAGGVRAAVSSINSEYTKGHDTSKEAGIANLVGRFKALDKDAQKQVGLKILGGAVSGAIGGALGVEMKALGFGNLGVETVATKIARGAAVGYVMGSVNRLTTFDKKEIMSLKSLKQIGLGTVMGGAFAGLLDGVTEISHYLSSETTVLREAAAPASSAAVATAVEASKPSGLPGLPRAGFDSPATPTGDSPAEVKPGSTATPEPPRAATLTPTNEPSSTRIPTNTPTSMPSATSEAQVILNTATPTETSTPIPSATSVPATETPIATSTKVPTAVPSPIASPSPDASPRIPTAVPTVVTVPTVEATQGPRWWQPRAWLPTWTSGGAAPVVDASRVSTDAIEVPVPPDRDSVWVRPGEESAPGVPTAEMAPVQGSPPIEHAGDPNQTIPSEASRKEVVRLWEEKYEYFRDIMERQLNIEPGVVSVSTPIEVAYVLDRPSEYPHVNDFTPQERFALDHLTTGEGSASQMDVVNLKSPDALYANSDIHNPEISSLKGEIEGRIGHLFLKDPDFEETRKSIIDDLLSDSTVEAGVKESLQRMKDGVSSGEFNPSDGAHALLLERFSQYSDYRAMFDVGYILSKSANAKDVFAGPDLFKHNQDVLVPKEEFLKKVSKIYYSR